MSIQDNNNDDYINIDEQDDSSFCEKCNARIPTRNTFVVIICLLLGLSTIVLAGIIFAISANKQHSGQVIHMSDFHLDAYYNSRISIKCRCHWKPEFTCNAINSTSSSGKFGSFGCDSPSELIQSALKAAVEVSKGNKDLLPIIVSGDYTRHATHDYSNPSRLVLEAFVNVSKWMKAYGFKTIIPVYGNDDFAKNYYFNVSKDCKDQTLLASTSKEIIKLLPNYFHDDTTDSADSTMSCYGYYHYNIENGIRVFSLNTILYSVKHHPEYTLNEIDDPGKQFQWMEQQLQKCSKDFSCRAVWILGHIPPGREHCMGTASWKDRYVSKYIEILEKWSPLLIKAQFFGHEHINAIRMINNNTDIPPIIIAAAVSPVYLNRPSFRVIDYDRNLGVNYGKVLDFHVHGLIGSNFNTKLEWSKRFSAKNEFHLNNLSSQSVSKWIDTFIAKPMNQPFQTFIARTWDRDASPPAGNECPSTQPNICWLKYVLERDIKNCMHEENF